MGQPEFVPSLVFALGLDQPTLVLVSWVLKYIKLAEEEWQDGSDRDIFEP